MSYDVIILGSGVTGATAAGLLARNDLRVALLDKVDLTEKALARPDWLTAAALDILKDIGLDQRGWLGKAFPGAVFHSADLSKSAEAIEKNPPGYRIDYSALVKQLNRHVAKMGVERIVSSTAAIEAGEDRVDISLENDETIKGRFLLTADGVPRAADDIYMYRVAQGRLPTKAADDDKMHWVLGMDSPMQLACWWYEPQQMVINLHGQGTAEELKMGLAELVSNLGEKNLLPKDTIIDQGTISVRATPPESALGMDTHVSKRGLVIGDAGGFIPDMSREGIYSSLWSASLAVEVIISASCSKHPQDELRRFSSLWRTTMAEYLRPPHTDARFLTPMVFNNQQIAKRVAAAFWRGENI